MTLFSRNYNFFKNVREYFFAKYIKMSHSNNRNHKRQHIAIKYLNNTQKRKNIPPPPKRPLLPKNCHLYPSIIKLDTVIPYLKKIFESSDTPLQFCWYPNLLTRNQQISLYQEAFLFKSVLINMVTTLKMSTKMATLGPLKMKVFWCKVYNVIISVYDVTN